MAASRSRSKVRHEVVDEKLSQGWADAEAKDLDEAIRMADEAAESEKARSPS